ncbi:ferredoxin [Rhodobacter maris]|uniref:4Fe-4S ferredoxin-type domain-containing protein n=1 Tax=Rhodobacter maris TaxID=446682 RepID=A0A285RKZ5_9RHOB|nr:ferredoxin [Rhodobacter maris]SOB94781.1 hypothetical protein SAMN05877831_101626 [Rhodobacter maris]
MNLPEALPEALDAARLFVAGIAHDGAETVILLAPEEPGFWAHVTAQPEFEDGAADPLDRWSKRVIGRMAAQAGGRALFPSDGPPFPPFYRWAIESGQAFAAPTRLLVHRRMGLQVSLRGALLLPGHLPQPVPGPSPCEGCPAPCTETCPAGAMTATGYDVPACRSFLNTEAGANCLSLGCLARQACPLSRSYGRLEQQSAWHLRQFHT